MFGIAAAAANALAVDNDNDTYIDDAKNLKFQNFYWISLIWN